jgi:ubiquinol-cytochrome c reductase cytochrome c1 subunit
MLNFARKQNQFFNDYLNYYCFFFLIAFKNYIYSLLTGYQEAPAGVEKKEGLHYNPYFNGGWIGMAQALYDEVIEYSDGTAASASQLAKDVTEFLRWSAEKSHDEKKKTLLKVCSIVISRICSCFLF